MKVLKFGGTSVGTAPAIKQVRDIVCNSGSDVIVVVSALGGITDMLISTADMAVSGNADYQKNLDTIRARHMNTVAGVVCPDMQGAARQSVEVLMEELSNIYKGIYLIGDVSAKTHDTVVSYGERMSSLIVSGAIKGSKLADSRRFIKTRNYMGRHNIDFDLTDHLIHETFRGGGVFIVPGFIASDADTGDTTTLGRGGSDYTASVIASALDAGVLEIWTDVDGFLTADPRIVPSAYVIEHLSYREAIELCNVGAKVIYPPTIFPVFHKNIPICVKNTFNPTHPGTFISNDAPAGPNKTIRGMSSLTDTCLITIQGLGMVGVIGVNYRIFKSLAKAGISVFLVAQAASENNTSIGVRTADSDKAVEVLSREFEQEISQGEINPIKRDCGLATIAIVGENMKKVPGIAGKLYGTLGRNGISVMAAAQGASEMNLSFVVKLEDQPKAMNVIHDSFFLSEYQVMNLFIAGVGNVGHGLLEQICHQQPLLQKNNALKIKVIGISNSKKYILDPEGIDLTRYKERLESEGRDSTPGDYRDQIVGLNMFNSVFVDCTASPDVASVYKSLLEKSISVVTANKIAASSSYGDYEDLKQTARLYGVKFLFETNVGAGLPVINTINDLCNSGDRILKIEAVVSGTLNFIFNEISDEVSLSKAIRMAQQAGYSEPDPRIDLSGTDVVRKLVILAREAGYRIEQEEVEKQLFIPPGCFEGSLDDFWRNIAALDEEFEQGRRQLEREGKRWRFVAVFDNGEARVSLQAVDGASPFYELAGSNNVILLTTERYREYPMQIKGYGAGAEVTAAGVFADIISIANIR